MPNSTSHSSWVLNHIISLDAHLAGFCGTFLRDTTSAERRQVIAAYLSAKPPTDGEMPEVAQYLLSSNHGSILAEAYGERIEGLRGALRRSGPVAHERCFYVLLHQLLANPPHKHIAGTISRLQSLDHKKLLILRMLPESIARGNVVESIKSVQDANDIATAFRLLVSRDVDEEALASAIRAIRCERELAAVWKTWVLKASFPPHPIPASEDYRPARKAKELHDLAMRYRNCARRYIPTALDEDTGEYFAEIKCGDHGAVVHLRRERGELRLEGAYGPRNSRPIAHLRERLHEYLSSHGVAVRDRRLHRSSDWECVQRLVASPFFEFDLE